MKKGSVIVDLAAENGGNCALTVPGAVVERHGVHIIGYIDLPSRLAPTASLLYGNNLANLLDDIGGAASFHIDLNDAVVRSALIVHDGDDHLAATAAASRHQRRRKPPRLRHRHADDPERRGSASASAVALAASLRPHSSASATLRRPHSCPI